MFINYNHNEILHLVYDNSLCVSPSFNSIRLLCEDYNDYQEQRQRIFSLRLIIPPLIRYGINLR